MKKFLAAVLTLAMVLSLAACGSKADKSLKVIDIPLTVEEYAYAVKKGNTELLNSVNAFLKEIKSNGKFDEIINEYFGSGTPKGVSSAAAQDPSKNQLVVATNAAFAPFEYMKGDKYYGVDMEIMGLFAEYLGRELYVSNMEFESVCTSVSGGQADIAASGLTVNDKRKETLDFSESYYNASQVIIAKSSDTTFDACKTAEDCEKILNGFDSSKKIGVQSATTGNFYVKGDADWKFDGFKVTCQPYDSAALAAQALLNGNLDYVIVDIAPAKNVVASVNEQNK